MSSRVYGLMYHMLISFLLETSILRRYQVGQPIETQQETEGESVVGNRYPQGPPSPAHCRSDRLPRVYITHSPGDGVLCFR
jgi:hypothetical protein